MVSKVDSELVQGMRGAISKSRMEQIHSALPVSITLREMLPALENPLSPPFPKGKQLKARARLSDGWHMLNQARMALIEADACTAFYEEIQHNHFEALYHARYYLDDAALRMVSSCEHMVQSIVLHWDLRLSKDVLDESDVTAVSTTREGSLRLAMKSAENSEDSLVSKQVSGVLRKLRSSKAWRASVKHRNDWVHCRLPATKDLFQDIAFKTVNATEIFQPENLKRYGVDPNQQYQKVAFGEGLNIGDIREMIRGGFVALLDAFRELSKILAAGC